MLGTADGGNATGIHGCIGDSGRYVHYEEDVSNGMEPDAQLHVISIYDTGDGTSPQLQNRGNVEVHVTRPGSVSLVLASYARANWIVTVASGVEIERIILTGYFAQTASAPAGTLIEEYSYETLGVALGFGIDWPSYGTADLVLHAEATTGRLLTSFRGCFASASFQIDAPEVHASRPRDSGSTSGTAEPAIVPGCDAVAAESTYCVTLAENRVAMVGLDSGTLCHGPEISSMTYDSPSLAWIGEYVYTCLGDRGIARISVIDGSIDVAPVACGLVTGHRDGLAATAMVDPNQSGPPLGHLVRFDSFGNAARRDIDSVYGRLPRSTLASVGGDRVYLASQSASSVYVADLDNMEEAHSIDLEGYDDWIAAMDVTARRELVISGPKHAGGVHMFDADTGVLQRVVPVSADPASAEPASIWGLDCVTETGGQ
ncbi:MAG: hypothetical protein MJE77_32380 [Proteobacteria bacterium]|nr:hypothetical protein [Pseudomonadota bacterium]